MHVLLHNRNQKLKDLLLAVIRHPPWWSYQACNTAGALKALATCCKISFDNKFEGSRDQSYLGGRSDVWQMKYLWKNNEMLKITICDLQNWLSSIISIWYRRLHDTLFRSRVTLTKGNIIWIKKQLTYMIDIQKVVHHHFRDRKAQTNSWKMLLQDTGNKKRNKKTKKKYIIHFFQRSNWFPFKMGGTRFTRLCWYGVLLTMQWPFAWLKLDHQNAAHLSVLQSDSGAFEVGHSLL